MRQFGILVQVSVEVLLPWTDVVHAGEDTGSRDIGAHRAFLSIVTVRFAPGQSTAVGSDYGPPTDWPPHLTSRHSAVPGDVAAKTTVGLPWKNTFGLDVHDEPAVRSDRFADRLSAQQQEFELGAAGVLVVVATDLEPGGHSGVYSISLCAAGEIRQRRCRSGRTPAGPAVGWDSG